MLGGCSKLLSVCRLDLEVVCAMYEVDGNAITIVFCFDFQFNVPIEFPVSSFITEGMTASFVLTGFVKGFEGSRLGSRPDSGAGSFTAFSNRV